MKKTYNEKENYIIGMSYEERMKHINRLIFEEYKDLMDGCLLYLGCNNGSSLYVLSKFHSQEKIFGLDINKESLDDARKKLNEKGLRKINLIHANLLNIPVPNNFFDNIYCLHVLEHIYQEDMDDALMEIKRVLKKDGHIIIEFPTPNGKDYASEEHVFFFDSKEKIKKVIGPYFKIKEIIIDDRENPGMPGKHNNWRIICQK